MICMLVLPAMMPCLTHAGEVIAVPSAGITAIGQAMVGAKSGDTIGVCNGVYPEHLHVKPGVTLLAGSRGNAILDGRGKGTVVTLGAHASVIGFEIRNGAIGVVSNDVGAAILNCRIVKNWSSGIVCGRYLPKIQDNIIAFNRGSGIQGWDARAAEGSITHNTIAYNGNNGIALGGSSSGLIEENMIVANERYGTKISFASSAKTQLTKNNIAGNMAGTNAIADGNYSFDPQFRAPREKMDFTATAHQNGSEDIGARWEK
jgi:parallel beta-helix repeat protein